MYTWSCFVGESFRTHADKFDETLFQFCYIDGTDCVQGMSESFHIISAFPRVADSPVLVQSNIDSTSFDSMAVVSDVEDDFVEIEDDDGEIVIIRSRTDYLHDELIKLKSDAKVDSCILTYIFNHIFCQATSGQGFFSRPTF